MGRLQGGSYALENLLGRVSELLLADHRYDNLARAALPWRAAPGEANQVSHSTRNPHAVRRLGLRGPQRKRVLRALTQQLVTGRNEVGHYWSGMEEDAARALLALDRSPAESSPAVQGLTARMHHYLDPDKARAFRLLGGHMDRAEVLELVRDVRQHEMFGSMSAHIVERCARGLGELDAAQDVRELVAGQLLDEADRDPSRWPGWWVQALSRLRPAPPTAARAVAVLISSAGGRGRR